MFATSLQENESMQIFLAVVIVILSIGLLALIIWLFLRERKRVSMEAQTYIEGIMSEKEMSASISSYISKNTLPEFSVIGIDIDKFSSVIESFGKDEADKLIKNLAYRIKDSLPNRVEMARTGYDEFALFLKGEYSHEDVRGIAKKLVTLISAPIKVFNETSINLTASLAVAYYPNHGENFKELKNSLDIATYICKKEGGNQYKVYTIEQGNKESTNLEYYRQIKEAMKNKEFTLYYQPMIDSSTKSVFGVEGLLRWNHPELGVLSPYKFINIMEQSGDIKWVGEWGLECLIKEYQTVKSKGLIPNDYVFSLNLSPKQLANEDLIEGFTKLIKKYKADTSKIVFEISEFTLFDRHDEIKRNIISLKNMGFKIAVDGYGLDFNGIRRLQEMRVDIVKLDKEYMDADVDELLRDKFMNMLVEFSKKNMGYKILAEGIENVKEMNVANSFGINLIQGYNFAKPMPEEELLTYLKTKEYLNHFEDIEETVKEEIALEKKENETTENVEEKTTETIEENEIEVEASIETVEDETETDDITDDSDSEDENKEE